MPDHVLAAMRDTIAQFKEIFGDRFYGEVQWNDIKEQHEGNNLIIQACMEMGVEVISTADSHYPRPELWKDREMYKRIGWGGKIPEWADPDSLLPASVDEVGYELYPKNGDQMWESYKSIRVSTILNTTIPSSVTALSAHITSPLTDARTSCLTALSDSQSLWYPKARQPFRL